jgi:pyruvate dehydrogenase E1 component
MAEKNSFHDIDPIETKEWKDALDSVIEYESTERAEFIINQLIQHANRVGVTMATGTKTPYVNTITTDQQAPLPEDAKYMARLIDYFRWNALAMVIRVSRKKAGLGGHISSYASMATLFEVGLNYFFCGPDDKESIGGDLIFFQGHSAEGIYARAFLEGRISEAQLVNFRQEAINDGVSSYPHPYLMPNFWQFPTVSMGLGPLMAIYQAQFLKYLDNRGLADTKKRKVWAFCGDGEMSEPEAQGALTFASREKLDNLIFVVNCNLQRLDGPVAGNSQIIQELEGVFRGAGWRVIKVIWGSDWEPIFAKDVNGLLLKRISELIDGEYQSYSAHDGAYFRQNFFGKDPELLKLVEHLTDNDLKNLTDGGHDPQKVYAAFSEAVKDNGQPTVILAKTKKGYGYGKEAEGQNIAHNLEAISVEGLKAFRDRFRLPLTDAQVEALEFIKPSADSAEMQYLQQQRKKLGGYLPSRDTTFTPLVVPELSEFDALLQSSGERSISTTMAFSRILMTLLKDKNLKERIVPIFCDEARTFGLEGVFRQAGIYAIEGQKYVPEDHDKLVTYHEEKDGQVLQQGISEAGAMSSWIAAGTSYANNRVTMIPFYIYYAMFGYQRVGDLMWAAGDLQAHGFILGGLAGRTTLAGEGLQHQDAHNLLMYSAIPTCMSYDPTFAYEVAVIIQDGLRRMYRDKENVFYYLTLMNENYIHPEMPEGVEAGIIKGMYLFKRGDEKLKTRVQLLGSGAILREVIAAQEILEKQFDIAADVWSVPSFSQLRRDIESIARYNRLHPQAQPKQSYVETCLQHQSGPVIAATDYMKIYADQIRQGIKNKPYYVLGTDGFGRSDTRPMLRNFFEVDAKMIAYTALKALADQNEFDKAMLTRAMEKLTIDPNRPDPWTV